MKSGIRKLNFSSSFPKNLRILQHFRRGVKIYVVAFSWWWRDRRWFRKGVVDGGLSDGYCDGGVCGLMVVVVSSRFVGDVKV